MRFGRRHSRSEKRLHVSANADVDVQASAIATNIGRIIVSHFPDPAQLNNFSEASTFPSDRSMPAIAEAFC
jgi:hypothetical protein